jgi:hypothetical protein
VHVHMCICVHACVHSHLTFYMGGRLSIQFRSLLFSLLRTYITFFSFLQPLYLFRQRWGERGSGSVLLRQGQREGSMARLLSQGGEPAAWATGQLP